MISEKVLLQINTDSLVSFVWVFLLMGLLLYGQRIQLFIMLRKISKDVNRLEKMRNDSRIKITTSFKEINNDSKIISEKLDRIFDSFVINPIAMDPKGIITKLEHLLNIQEDMLKDEIESLSKDVDEVKSSQLQNLLEIGIFLNTSYKIVRHFYISGKKTSSAFVIAQLQMILPQIMEQSEAYFAAIHPIDQRKTIGDGLGPLIASRLSENSEKKEIVANTTLNEINYEGRKLFIVKAKGPGGHVGKPGEAIKQIVNKNKDISLIITVDAALKLEGETSGEIAEGIGAAIGGPGVERFKIEKVASDNQIPTLALVSKMSEKEAITEMNEKIKESSERIMEKVKEVIINNSKENQKIIVAGIGNTLGVE